MPINPQRLSKIITNRDCNNATDHLIQNVIAPMSKEQREEIRNMLINNKNDKSK